MRVARVMAGENEINKRLRADRTRILRRDLTEPRAFDGRTDRAQSCFHFAALNTSKNVEIYPKANSGGAGTRRCPAETGVHVTFVSVIESFRLNMLFG